MNWKATQALPVPERKIREKLMGRAGSRMDVSGNGSVGPSQSIRKA